MKRRKWQDRFRDRHPCLSLRKPEGLSAARGTMLNPNVITEYFTKLGDLMNRHNIQSKPQQIFNETGFSTVHQTSKVVGSKGKKAIHAVVKEVKTLKFYVVLMRRPMYCHQW